MFEDQDKPAPERHPGGRPTDYDPAYCESVLAWGALGKSKVWMAAEIGVAKSTLQLWEKVHPEFSAALSRAMTLSQRWWEDEGQCGMRADKFNGQVWGRSMAARFPEDWREQQNIDLNGTLQVTEIKRTIVDPRNQDA